MPMKQPPPIAVRPRKGSDLEQIWDDHGRSNKEMGRLIHSWAFQFRNMVEQSDKGNDDA